MTKGLWIARFPVLAEMAPADRALLSDRSQVASLPAGAPVFGPGQEPENLLLLLEGRVRVRQTALSGREIVLYRVEAGETCVLTTACLMAHEAYCAEAAAETEITAVLIPKATFETLMACSEPFRRFVFEAYSRRLTNLFATIEDVAFRRTDLRLAEKLLALCGPDDVLRLTHHDLAVEIGSAREVVSRQLQEFQRRGWIESGRGSVRLSDRAALKRFVDAD